ncbi:MAG: hypothetical protein KDC98_12865 [Planctomycetes bacterium]|nr:hypothetical protein [Planctomycetota bacterium]
MLSGVPDSASGPYPGRGRGVAHDVAWLVLPLALVYWPAWLGAYVGDDHRLIENNVAVHEHDFAAMMTSPLFGIEDGYWRPVTVLGFWLGHTLAGATGVHLLAFALHVAATFAVRELAARFLSAKGARWTALAFALYPIQVESVAWCAALNDVLWSFMALRAMLAVTAWRDRVGGGGLGWVGVWCLLALLAKETGAAALALVPAAAAWLPGREGGAARVRWPALLAVLAAVLTVWAVARTVVLDVPIAGALLGLREHRVDVDPSRIAELLSAQLLLLAWPLPLLPVRVVPPLGAAPAVGAVLVAVALLGAVWRSRLDPRWAFAAAVLLLPLLPSLLHHDTIGLYPIADRYLYLPVAGAVLLVMHVPWPARVRRVGPVLVLAMAACSWRGAFLRHDDQALAVHALAYMPHDPGVLAMAADAQLPSVFDADPWALMRCERLYHGALARVDAQARDEQSKRIVANAHLGLAWCGLMRWSEADAQQRPPATAVVDAFWRAVEVDPRDPAAWVGLGIACGEASDLAASQAAFEKALVLDPRNAQARAGLQQLSTARR